MPNEPKMPTDQLATALRPLPDWHADGDAITRTFKTDGWTTTLMLVNLIGFYCEAADHHPDLHVSYDEIVIRLNTHTAGGVTAKDVELARQLEAAALWKPKGGALTGTKQGWITGAGS